MSEETDAIGTKKYVYDKLGRIVETISGEGYITSYRYDGVGNIIEKQMKIIRLQIIHMT